MARFNSVTDTQRAALAMALRSLQCADNQIDATRPTIEPMALTNVQDALDVLSAAFGYEAPRKKAAPDRVCPECHKPLAECAGWATVTR